MPTSNFQFIGIKVIRRFVMIRSIINRNFLALAMREILVGIPKNLISAMNAFVVGSVFSFGDFLWHTFIFR